MQIPIFGKVKQPLPWALGLVAAGLVGVGGTAYIVTQRLSPKQNVADLTVPVQAQTLTVRITATGTVTPFQTVNLSPKSAGRVAELRVEQGDRVQKGDLIARMESRDLEAQRAQLTAVIAQAEARLALLRNGSRPEEIAQAQSAVSQSESQVAQAQARLRLASQRVQRNQSLYSEGAISRDRLDEVLNEQQTAQANLDQVRSRVGELNQRLGQLENGARREEIAQAQAQVDEARARLQVLETQIDDTSIRAPFSGIITQKYAVEGAFVTPTTSASTTSSATSTSIVALANGMEVLAEVPEVDIGQIKLGQPVEIVADAYPDKVFKGKVRLIAPAAVKEQNVTSFQIRVALTSGNDQLRPGMNTNLTFLGEQIKNALVVPTTAIVTQKGQSGVLIPDSRNKPQFQAVVIGTTIGNQTQVLQGLTAGQQVFTELPEGLKLKDVQRAEDDSDNQ